MSQSILWSGLENEVRVALSARAFNDAKTRHAVLAPYGSLSDLLASISPKNEDHREAALIAILKEHRQHSSRVWSAALALAMRPTILTLTRNFAKLGDEAEPTVFAAFYETASRIHTMRRIGLRLYSTTRRMVLCRLRDESREASKPSDFDVDALGGHEPNGIEEHIDQARFVRRALALPVKEGESVGQYVVRMRLHRTWEERWRARHDLARQRRDELTGLVETIQSVA